MPLHSLYLRSGWFWFSIFWAILIFIGSVIPAVDLPSVSIWEADKLVHALIYCVLTFSVAFVFSIQITGTKKMAILWSACVSILYSISIELIQKFLPTRSFDVFDILANCIGTGLGIFLLLLFLKGK